MKIDSLEALELDGAMRTVKVILPYFNESLGLKLLDSTVKELRKLGVAEENIDVVRVFGALEIPFAAKSLIEEMACDVIIALGVVVRGDTTHYELVTENVYRALMDVQLKGEVPVIFGILTCENVEQVEERLSKGADFARAAILQCDF